MNISLKNEFATLHIGSVLGSPEHCTLFTPNTVYTCTWMQFRASGHTLDLGTTWLTHWTKVITLYYLALNREARLKIMSGGHYPNKMQNKHLPFRVKVCKNTTSGNFYAKRVGGTMKIFLSKILIGFLQTFSRKYFFWKSTENWLN